MTIREVASLAGVSAAAVSRYLNGGSLSEEKRERIREAIKETGYQPDSAARLMRTGKVHQIGVIVPKICSDAVSRIVDGVTAICRERGFLVVLCNTDGNRDLEKNYISFLQNKNAAGLIIMGVSMTPAVEDALKNCQIPFVITGQNYEAFPCVFNDDFHAVYALVDMVIKRGRRKIAYLGVSDEDLAAGSERRRGAVSSAVDSGIAEESLIIENCSFSAASGYAVMEKVLREHPDTDGVVCATDTIAVGARAAIRKAGRKVPEDISLAGVGDSWMDEFMDPPLTTAQLFHLQCGKDAAKMLFHMIDGDDSDGPMRQTLLTYRIVERDSI